MRVVDAMMRALTLIIVISIVAGLAAALVGGSLSDLGSGYGGLYGLPGILLSAVALLVGIPAAVVIRRRLGPESGRLRIAVLVTGGVWVVALGYSMVAHAVDPCANGWWDARSRIGSQPLCERFGSGLSWHTRFHLLAHAAPAAVLLVVYVYVIKRWGRPKESRLNTSHSALSPNRLLVKDSNHNHRPATGCDGLQPSAGQRTDAADIETRGGLLT